MTTAYSSPIHRYTNGTPYRQAMGRSAERCPVEDRLAAALAVMDRLHGNQQPTRNIFPAKSSDASAAQPPVGELRLQMRKDPDPKSDETQVTIQIVGNEKPDFLLGIRARMSRPGFVTLEIPPLESWQPVLDRLPQQQVDRIIAPSFYELLQTQITARLIADSARHRPARQ